ncbi:MAG: NAD-dependent epimerase/dehydratase family protein [Acidobacteriia bacterium]|nr:NAD-dependent epimerase/dehydratase family protein [Terriglobia bacterium]
MNLADEKILVTGVTGFIGGRLALRLVSEKRAVVRGLARDPAKARSLAETGIEIVQGDMRDAASLRRAVEGCSVVIHAAAQVSSVPDRQTFVDSNVAGTENILRASEAAGVRRFVHLSSVAVFGLAAQGNVTDQAARAHSGDPYCDTKVDSEELVFRYHREGRVPATVLRPSSVYGPGSTHWTIIPLKRIKKGRMLLFDGGRGRLNYVYIDNLVDAILLAAEDERALGEAFIVNDGASTWREYFDAYARMAGKKKVPSIPLWAARFWVRYRNLRAVLRHEPYRIHPNGLGFLVSKAIFDQTHIERTLGHRSRVTLEEGLRRTESWCREVGLLNAEL